jgi:plastocyanin
MGSWHSSMMGGWGASTGAPPIQGAAEVAVVATEFAFSPNEITVAAGRPINLTLVNEGSVPHDLVVPELDLRVEARPGQSSTAGFAPSERGQYSIVCTYAGHAGAGMRATMIVVGP